MYKTALRLSLICEGKKHAVENTYVIMLICSFPDLVGGQIFCKAMPTRCPHAVTRTGRVRLGSLLITGLLVTPYLILSTLATPTNAFLDDDDYTYTSEDKLSSGRFCKPLSIYCRFPNYLGSQKEAVPE